ncbi:MAG: ribonuclease HII [Methanoregulaceae archaeon]|jgi:ribonuclease HII|nr:ribonuclease HII [Methanoregulaceae archaeon]
MFVGVDEAGKGAVLGPLVVACVGCESDEDLAGIPVRDSKTLTPAARTDLFSRITASVHYTVLVIAAGEIDSRRRSMTMNQLMAMAHATVIRELQPAIAYVDACDVVAPRFGRAVTSHLDIPCRVIAQHHADATIPVVSAAGIVAKVVRDRLIRELAEEYGEIGSGYPSDETTIVFIEDYIGRNGRPPPIARSSWETTRQILCRAEQTDLSFFAHDE